MTTSGHTEQVRDAQFASTLASGIDILACFKAGEVALGNKEFSERTGLSRSTVARLTHTLLALGYLRRDHGTRRYRPGAALLTISYPLLASLQLRQIARPLMVRLATEINGAVSLVMRDRHQMIYAETARANESLITHPDIGAALPMLSTAAGNAWLFRATAEQRNVVLNQVKLYDPDQYARHASQFDALRRYFERHGVCGNDLRWNSDAYGFAVPMSRTIDANLFVFNCGVPTCDGSFHRRAGEIGPKLQSLVQGIEDMLGLRD